MANKLKENAVSKLAIAIGIADTTVQITAGTKATRFPTLAANDWFYAKLTDTSGNYEYVKATSNAGADVFTIARAQLGTSALSFASGSAFALVLTSADLAYFVNQAGSAIYAGTAGGTADALTASLTPAPAQLSEVGFFMLKASADNATTTPTLNLNSFGPLTIVKENNLALAVADIKTNAMCLFFSNGTNHVLLNPRTLSLLLPLAGGTMTGAVNFGLSTVASSVTPDIWTNTANTISYTGVITATGFAAAPQAGAQRRLVTTGGASFTAGVNMLIQGVASGSTYTATAGDIIEVTAITTTQFRLVIERQDGAASNTSQFTNSLGADVLINTSAIYFDGPSVAQGTTGTWFANGTVTVQDTVGAANMNAKLWDGTTVIASTTQRTEAASAVKSLSLSGYITNPAANIRISVADSSSASGKILFNFSGSSKDSTISVLRIK